jgi:hypothetical protein
MAPLLPRTIKPLSTPAKSKLIEELATVNTSQAKFNMADHGAWFVDGIAPKNRKAFATLKTAVSHLKTEYAGRPLGKDFAGYDAAVTRVAKVLKEQSTGPLDESKLGSIAPGYQRRIFYSDLNTLHAIEDLTTGVYSSLNGLPKGSSVQHPSFNTSNPRREVQISHNMLMAAVKPGSGMKLQADGSLKGVFNTVDSTTHTLVHSPAQAFVKTHANP